MTDLYCIPAYATDYRLFEHLKLSNYKIHFIDWVEPDWEDSIGLYAEKLVPQIDTSKSFALLGISLGGFIAVELAVRLNTEKVFVISSLKSSEEFPNYWTVMRKLRIDYLVTAKIVRKFKWLIEPIFGNMSDEDKATMNKMIADSPGKFVNWAPRAIAKWKTNDSSTPFDKIVHIIGDRDLLYSKSRIKDCLLIENGSHLMIFDRAVEIGKLVDSFA